MNEDARTMSDWISTSEAAALVGYTQGYIRYLAREEKIEARKVTPRAWIVHKPSLLQHKRTVEPGRPRESEREVVGDRPGNQ